MVRWSRRLENACAQDADAEPEADTEGEEEPRETCAVGSKTVRASFDAARGVPHTHIVSAQLDSGLVVAQTAVPDKGNELTAIRQLLPKLEPIMAL